MDEISIFFAIEAEELLESGNATAAADLCKRGIEQYQDYPLAYTVLARAYSTLGETENMKNVLSEAEKLFPGHKSIRSAIENEAGAPEVLIPIEIQTGSVSETDSLVEEADKAGVSALAASEAVSSAFANPGPASLLSALKPLQSSGVKINCKSNDIRVIPGLNSILLSRKSEKSRKSYSKLPVPPKLSFFGKSNIPDDFQNYTNCFFDDLSFDEIPVEDYFLSKAREIANSKADYVPVQENPSVEDVPETTDDNETTLVTDTIAKIYEIQGALEEAVKVYEALLVSKPENKDFYLSKIAELKKKI